jgi:acyl-CoA thioesterase YciA
VARITREGRTSLTVAVEMYVEELLSRNRQLATTGSFVFVAIDTDGKATPIRDD